MSGRLFAQINTIDSLIITIKNTQTVNYLPLFDQLKAQISKLDSAKQISQAASIVNQFSFPRNEKAWLLAMRNLAIIHRDKKDFFMAVQTATEAYEQTGVQDRLEIAVLAETIAYCYVALLKADLALQYFLIASDEFQHINMPLRAAEMYYEAANLHYSVQDYPMAKKLIVQTIKLAEGKTTERYFISALNTLGLIARSEIQNEQAHDYFARATQVAIQAKDSIWIGIVAGNWGRVYEQAGDYPKAMANYYIALMYSQKYAKHDWTIRTLSSMAKVAILQKQFANAKQDLDSALLLADKHHIYFEREAIYKISADYYDALGNFEKAYRNHLKYNEVRDSLTRFENKLALGNVELTYNFDKKQAEIEVLKKENVNIRTITQRQYLLIIFGIFCFIVVGVLVYILYNSIIYANQLHKELEKRQVDLEQNNEEIKSQNDHLVSLNEKMTVQKNQILEQRNFLKDLTENIDEQKEKIKLQNKNLEEANQVIREQNKEIETQLEQLILANTKVIEQKDAILKQRNSFKRLLENLDKYKDKLIIHKRQVKTQRNDLKRLIEVITRYKDQIQSQKEELVAQKEELISLNEEIKTMYEQTEGKVQERTGELQIAVQKLLKQNQDLEQFSFIVSHNLRAPVARILGLSNIFNFEKIDDLFNVEVLNKTKLIALELDTILHDLTNILTIRSNLEQKMEMVDLRETLDQVAISLQSQIEEAEADISIDFAAISHIYSIKEYVRNIFFQLLSNALKFRRQRRQLFIEIQASYLDSYVCISFKDNGLGINLLNIDPYKVFGLYQRMHTHVEGKGLGLYLVKTEIEMLGGRAEVQSEDGKGSIFTVFFPQTHLH
jgi:signal transduction histidine kinase